MSRAQEAKAWSAFWASERRKGGGCLPSAWQGIDRIQVQAWQRFAEDLRVTAKVLDLGTGDARVLATLKALSPRYKLQGVDLAPALPDPPQGIRTRGGVAMEDLPFSDESFDAVTAQFAYEYGDPARVAAEIARVLKPGGKVGLITHRGDGPILAHNLVRRDAIRWAIEEQELVEKGKKSLALRALGQIGVPPALAAAPNEGARRFGPQSAAWEIAEAVRQTLAMGARDHPANVSATLDRIAHQAHNELGRIDSLEMACRTADDAVALNAAFAAAGLDQREIVDLAEPGRPPFAHFRTLTL
jgi:SAM-dependent methyltransferase